MYVSTGSAEGRHLQPDLGQFLRAPGTGGAEGDRTPDLVIANDALSHLSYGPVPVRTRDASRTGPMRAAPLAKQPPA